MKPKGEHLQSSPTNQKPLLQAWKITKSQADQKFLRLVQTGIEPNPGPSPHQPTSKQNKSKQDFTVASVNVRDAPGLWRLITLMETSHLADIICVQEPCLKMQEWTTVQQKLAKLHDQIYYCPGKQSTKAYGGVLTAVRTSIPHKLVSKYESHDHQHMAIQIKQWLLYNSYMPPRQHVLQQGQQTLRDIMQHTKAAAGNRPWIAMGDYNMLPTEVRGLFSHNGGALINQQCRWQSNRNIDHMHP